MKIVVTDKLDRGLSYAEACFETFRVINGAVFGWQAHIERLQAGLHLLGMDLGNGDLVGIEKIVREQAAKHGNDALVRITVTGGEAPWGMFRRASAPNLYVQAMPFSGKQSSARLHLMAWPFPLKPRPAKFTADYAETLRAMKGTDADVVFEQDGLLIAAAMANLLIYREGDWHTPDGDGILPGVIRAHLIQQGVVKPGPCPVDWLNDCEALALSNSGQFIRSVAALDEMREFDEQHPAFDLLKRSLTDCEGVRT